MLDKVWTMEIKRQEMKWLVGWLETCKIRKDCPVRKIIYIITENNAVTLIVH